ncbi:MAG: hypothetical protein H0X03_09270, partial [Nitrosopumilus sp.]|nr:hypothetical protein [Nitrosopumilus sp.]
MKSSESSKTQKGFPNISIFIVILAILGLVYSTMLIGVYLSSIHQGLSCLTWPLCPNGFNFPPPEYFVEHFHRFFVLIVAIMLFSFTIFSFIKIPNKGFKTKLLIASILLITQII